MSLLSRPAMVIGCIDGFDGTRTPQERFGSIDRLPRLRRSPKELSFWETNFIRHSPPAFLHFFSGLRNKVLVVLMRSGINLCCLSRRQQFTRKCIFLFGRVFRAKVAGLEMRLSALRAGLARWHLSLNRLQIGRSPEPELHAVGCATVARVPSSRCDALAGCERWRRSASVMKDGRFIPPSLQFRVRRTLHEWMSKRRSVRQERTSRASRMDADRASTSRGRKLNGKWEVIRLAKSSIAC